MKGRIAHRKIKFFVELNNAFENVGRREVEEETIDRLYNKSEKSIDFIIPEAIPNQNFILINGKKSVLVKYRDGKIHKIERNKLQALHLVSKNAEQAFAMSALLDPEISLVTIEGRAGTGKTIITLACALEQMCNQEFDELLFTRQTISVGNREIGFLPGDPNEKIAPFMNGMMDNLGVLKTIHAGNSTVITNYMDTKKILIEPLSFIRGRSLHRNILIIDESQNLTVHEVKTIATRAGEGTKLVFIGDTAQIDHPFLDRRSNGFSYLIEKFTGQKCHSHIHLVKGERSPLAELAGDLL